jgi:hypothetical protein
MVGIGALYIGHVIRKSEIEYGFPNMAKDHFM